MNRRGFTLLELLIAISILMVIAGGVVVALDQTKEDALLQVNRSEILKIKQAIMKFKQDTGFLPKQGRFSLTSDIPPGQVAIPIQGSSWFHSPANFIQLYEEPVNGGGNSIMPWNPDTGRGWRGPYLTRHGEGLVDIGDGLNPNGSGNPTVVATSTLINVRAVADPFVARPVNVGSYTECAAPSEANCLLDWRTVPAPPDETHLRWGRPYFLFDLNNANARIVGMGPNGLYNGGGSDDVVLDLIR